MTEDVLRKATRLIENHGDFSRETVRSLQNPESDVDRSAREIITREKELSFIVEYLEKQGRCPNEVRNGLEEVGELNERMIQEYQGDYYSLLEEELLDLVDRYPTVVCHFFELEPLEMEVEQDLLVRDSIEILLAELPRSKVPEKARATIDALDDVLACKCELHRSKYDKIADTVSRPYYPTEFWWRHPDKVLTE